MVDGRIHCPIGWTSGSDVNSQRVEDLEKKIIELQQSLKGKCNKQDLESMEKRIEENIDNKLIYHSEQLTHTIDHKLARYNYKLTEQP